MSAMQDMLLNMLLPPEEREQLKQLLTPENIKAFINGSVSQYKEIRAQQTRIEQNQAIIMKSMGLEPVAHDSHSDGGQSSTDQQRLAS